MPGVIMTVNHATRSELLANPSLLSETITQVVNTQNAENLEAVKELTGKQYLSTAELRRLGHPYSRRHPGGFFPITEPQIINTQTGFFNESWQVQDAEPLETYSSGGIRAWIVNNVPYARYLSARGSSKMIGRPLVETVAANNKVQFTLRLRTAISQLIRK